MVYMSFEISTIKNLMTNIDSVDLETKASWYDAQDFIKNTFYEKLRTSIEKQCLAKREIKFKDFNGKEKRLVVFPSSIKYGNKETVNEIDWDKVVDFALKNNHPLYYKQLVEKTLDGMKKVIEEKTISLIELSKDRIEKEQWFLNNLKQFINSKIIETPDKVSKARFFIKE